MQKAEPDTEDPVNISFDNDINNEDIVCMSLQDFCTDCCELGSLKWNIYSFIVQ